jgi:hypothetical protein
MGIPHPNDIRATEGKKVVKDTAVEEMLAKTASDITPMETTINNLKSRTAAANDE